jgi:hypothetical protein
MGCTTIFPNPNPFCIHRKRVVARVSGGLEISQNETQMAQWLLTNGPISVGLNANAMQFYMGGVSHPFKFLCSADGRSFHVSATFYGTLDMRSFMYAEKMECALRRRNVNLRYIFK